MQMITKETFQVLVVDDEVDICEILSEFLRLNGYVVISKNSAVDALEYMKNQPVHLIVSDVRMPQKSGIEFLTEVRTNYGRHIPFIIITGQSDVGKEEAIEWGATAFYDKPIDFMHLVQKINEQFVKVQERWRARKRLPSNLNIAGKSPRCEFKARVANISDGGVLLTESDCTLWPGDDIEFTISADNSSLSVRGRGLIKWASNLDNGKAGAGLQFININEDHLDELIKLVESQG